MTPEEIKQVAQMRAMALRGQEPQMTRDAEVLSGVGGALAGLGGRSGAAISKDMTGRGDLLRQLANQQQMGAQREAGDVARSIYSEAAQRDRNNADNAAAMERLKLELGAKEAANKAEAGGKVFEREDKYRTQMLGLQPVKDAMGMAGAYKGIKNAIEQNTAPGDMAAVFQFMKVLDPTSSVLQGEYASAKNSAGVPDQIRNLYNQSLTGKLLGAKQRKEFLATAKGKYTTQLREAKKYADFFGDLAAQDGGNPARVLAGLDFADLEADAPPAAGVGASGLTPEQRQAEIARLKGSATGGTP